MRHISFALTTEQVRNRTKTVTRRLGWKLLKPGTLLQPVEKCQGIPKGGKVEKIGGPIRVLKVEREPLSGIFVQQGDLRLEGFPNTSPATFVRMFCEHNGCDEETYVTRIEFEYVD